MNLTSTATTLRFLWSHPLAARDRAATLKRWASWQLGSRLLPGSVVVPFVEGTSLIVAPGMTGATGNIYVGLHEFADMGFLLHYLRPEDHFADVGANVGSYTVLAAGVAHATCVAIEPIPQTFQALQANLRINDVSGRVRALNVGVAAVDGVLRFTERLDSSNHVVPASGPVVHHSVEVVVQRLDALLVPRRPTLIKMDVEGFEMPVLEGAHETLSCPDLEAVIIELNGLGTRYGTPDTVVHDKLRAYGFHAHLYDPFSRSLRARATIGGDNVLYLRNPASAEQRVRAARTVRVLGQEV